jgi:hypothetical protein
MISSVMATWRDWVPGAAAFLGLCLGLVSAVEDLRLQRLSYAGAAAAVNGRVVAQEDVDRALATLAQDTRSPLTAQDRMLVLDRLIDDELLAQKALSLGLGASDPNARKILIRSLIDSLIAASPPPSDAELRAFHARNPALFARPVLLTVETRGERALPGSPMTIEKLKDYLGESAETLRSAKPGEVRGPFVFAGAEVFLTIIRRDGGNALPFEAARPEVEARYVLERDGQRVRDYLAGLRRAAQIERFE